MSTSSPSARHPTLITATLAFLCLSIALLQSVVSPVIGTIAQVFGASPASAAWASTAFLLSLSILTPIIGRLGDIAGKRRVLLVTIGVTLVGVLLSAVATDLPVFIVGRVVQGAAGGVFPLAFAILRDELPRDRVAGGIGLISALLGLGSGIGVVLSGVIVQTLSVHWLFWIPLFAIVVGLVGALLVIPESPVRARASINWLGALLLAAGLAALLLGITQSSSWGWGSPATLGLIALGLVLLVLWVVSESRSSSPLVDMRMMRRRPVWSVNLLALALGSGLFAALAVVPQYAQSDVGFGSSVIGGSLLVLPMSIVMVIVGPFAGRLQARVGAEIPALAGAVAAVAGFVLLALDHGSRLPILIALGLLGLGVGLAFAAMANLIVQSVEPDETGVATGVNTIARTLGGALGGQIALTLVSASATAHGPTSAGYEDAFVLMVGGAVVAVAAAFAVPGVTRRFRRGVVVDAPPAGS